MDQHRSPAAAKSPAQKAVSYSSSWVDRLQKEAQASELDYTNTSPSFFIFLSMVQLPVLLIVSYLTSPWTADGMGLNKYSYMAFTNMGFHWFGFSIAVIINSVWHFDITEDIGYFISIGWLYTQLKDPSPRQTLAFCCGMLWCVRICGFCGYRIIKRGSDFRFDKLNRAYAYQLFGWTSGGTWCFFNGFALWHCADADQSAPLGPLDFAGLALFALGIVMEMVADVQKYKFAEVRGKFGNKPWIASGLWGRSRHPNYFFENTLWFGVALLCMSGELTAYSVCVCLVTPVWSFVFLLFTSMMLLEKRADAKWGKDRAYVAYKAATPVWMPRLL